MSKTIWKFPILPPGRILTMPQNAEILSVAMQDGVPQLWALLDPEAAETSRLISVYGTGDRINGDPGKFIGTFMVQGGKSVFHVFDQGEIDG